MPIGQEAGITSSPRDLLDLVQQVERVAALAVELVDEGDDRHVAQPADLEELTGLLLDALGAMGGSSTITALGTAVRVGRCPRMLNSWWPGVSSRLKASPRARSSSPPRRPRCRARARPPSNPSAPAAARRAPFIAFPHPTGGGFRRRPGSTIHNEPSGDRVASTVSSSRTRSRRAPCVARGPISSITMPALAAGR